MALRDSFHKIKAVNWPLSGMALFMGGVLCGALGGALLQPDPPEKSALAEIVPDVPQKLVVEERYLDTPALQVKETTEENIEIKTVRLKRGDGLMDVVRRAGTKREEAYKAIQALSKHYDVRKLQIGQKLDLGFIEGGTLVHLEMRKDFDHLIVVRRNNDSYESTVEQEESLTITRHAEGPIDDSLFLAAQKEGLPQIVIVDLIRIFSFDVDFQREIRKGDHFEVFYERRLSEDGRRVEEGNILFAKLTLSGKEHNLYRYKPDTSKFAEYFHENGQSARKSLMKTPIEGARLSSYYGKRKHPVLGYTRMHKGLDFSAPYGTPIMAAGDGVIEKSRRFGSYGNYVRIRHNGTYKTAYAHLSKYGKGIKEGRRVKQGQIIGYVGATGRVTGRHLHYEVLVNGKQVNPLRLKIPSGRKLKAQEKEKFLEVAALIDRQIAGRKSHILLTANFPQTPNLTE